MATTGLIVAVGGLVALLKGQKDMHWQMNSRLDQLVEAQRGEANLQGQKEGREQERQRIHHHPPLAEEGEPR